MAGEGAPKFTLKVPWSDVKDVGVKLKELAKKSGEEVWSLTQWTMNQMKTRTPKSSGGGQHLKDSWVRERMMSAGIVRMIVIRNTSPHAYVLNFLEGGTVPHTITGNPILVFEMGGKTIFTRRVEHRGTRAYRIFEMAEKTLIPRLVALNKTILDKMARLLEKK